MPRWYLDRSVSLPALGTDYLGLPREAKYTSGYMPAIDMVEMTKNDGEEALDRDLDIMCAAFGDLRNVVKSIHGVLPDDADSGIFIKGNDLSVAQTANRHSASAVPVFRPGRSRARYDLMFCLYLLDVSDLPVRLVYWREEVGLYDRIEVRRKAILTVLDDPCLRPLLRWSRTRRLTIRTTSRAAIPKLPRCSPPLQDRRNRDRSSLFGIIITVVGSNGLLAQAELKNARKAGADHHQGVAEAHDQG
jgi:hypothetical protein